MDKKYFKIILGFYDVVNDDVAPGSAIATQLTTEVAVWNGTKGGSLTAGLEKITKYIIRKSCTMLVLHKRFTSVSYFLVVFWLFFGIDALRILKCKYMQKIMFHVSLC